jgi:hypothetical protein
VNKIKLLAGLGQGVENRGEDTHVLAEPDFVLGLEPLQRAMHRLDVGLGDGARVVVAEEHVRAP